MELFFKGYGVVMELTFVNVLGVELTFIAAFTIFGLVVSGIIAAILWFASGNHG